MTFNITESYTQKTVEIDLNSNWSFRKAGDTTGWMPAIVPGCVHTDLLANKIIPDPFYGDNEKLVQWVEREDWEYKTTFYVDRKFIKQETIEINFEGLDTYADVYINDSLVFKADNMFVEWRSSVNKYLKTGENLLYIKFNSSVRVGKELMNNYPIKLPGEERVFTRKAQYQYGWDWGPRLVTCGIWKPVKLIAFDYETYIYSASVIPGKVINDSVIVDLELSSSIGFHDFEKYSITLFNKKDGNEIPLISQKGHGEVCIIQFVIQHPEIWWCNGSGEQPLYTVDVVVKRKKQIIDRFDLTFAIRNIELKQVTDSYGKSFAFELNDKPIFIKGANYIPLHSFPSSLQKEDYRKILTEAKNMNMNMIRVWGGGIYEPDYFYELCDSLGILVWQDYMFACAMYPFHENINSYVNEIRYQTRRINKNGSVALWCGNNENFEGWNNWGWQKQFGYSESDSQKLWMENFELFTGTIPTETKYENVKNYHPSSPTHGWGRPEGLTEGDCHYWGVWWGKEPFEMYNYKIPRFMSEYGFQGMPVFNSFKNFIPENELNINSASVKNHQKHPVGYETIAEYMSRDYLIPDKFEDYIYVSQLLQAKGMQIAIEAHRRNKPYCMGTLFWQLNDCWPVTSWSSIDYYGNRKASYYSIKQKFESLMISVINENDSIKTYIVNDKDENLNATLEYLLIKTDGEILDKKTLSILLKPLSSILYSVVPLETMLENEAPERCILHLAIKQDENLLAETFFNFVSPKELLLEEPEFKISIDQITRNFIISSNVYAKNVYLYTDQGEIKLSDNFFDLLPNEPKEISLQENNYYTLPGPIKIKCLNTLYND